MDRKRKTARANPVRSAGTTARSAGTKLPANRTVKSEAGNEPDPLLPLYANSGMFIDRELSWLDFNRRVLREAENPAVPLLERLRFIAIVGGNLDEFFEVRVAALLQRIESGASTDGIARLDIQDKLKRVLAEARAMTADQYACWDAVRADLALHGARVLAPSELSTAEAAFAHAWFVREAYSLLTPIVVDPSHPFPRLLNKALCLAFRLKTPGRGREALGVMTVPRGLPRVIALPSSAKDVFHFVFTGDLVRHFAQELFRGYTIRESAVFRVTRNSNLYLDEDEELGEGSLLEAVEEEIRNRRRGDVVRLEIEAHASARLTGPLVRYLDLEPELVFRAGNPINLSRLSLLYGLIPLPGLKFPAWHPVPQAGFGNPAEVFGRLRENDLLLHHPFDSFDPVVRFIETVARDPQVLAIKTTLYRTSADSPIMFALMEAAQLGKEVVVVVELKARFDEQSNIHWARQLEERGGTVVYGHAGLKTHCKIALVVRREADVFRRYVHIGTGNYNPETARAYTDFSLFTCDPETTGGVSEVFNYLTAYAPHPDFRGLRVAPLTFLSSTLSMIRRESENARQGKPAGIAVKINALFDREVIEALYEASRAGVPVKLIVRGICALRPGAPGLSENIRVKSVIGRFLEHSRIFCFRNAGEEDVHIGSGDWMMRNLRERVEVTAPVRDPVLRARLLRVLAVYWADTTCSHWMRHDGNYTPPSRAEGDADPQGTPGVNAQEWLMRDMSGEENPGPIPDLWDD
jgi:polyphosphate kinase